ncbi:DUF4129 domain-containing protein [Bergeyella sp. RCAD1439]|uniref:DUF4129 domain-containing protein n=1 Tax=Bergeyella anatis TaxID=3113737 RepID=UPI002E1861BE|nr:DUF4129 domain-containing protein [Bergeyella sp. RCAD1439]
MRFSRLFFFVFFCGTLLCYGQGSGVVDSSSSFRLLPADSLLAEHPTTESKVEARVLDADFRARYKGEEYDYRSVKPKESLWEKIERRLNKLLHFIFGDRAPFEAGKLAEWVVRILAVVITGLVIYFLVRYFYGKQGGWFWGRKNATVVSEGQVLDENIHEINFPEQILAYERKGDFRRAVRYQFLYVLKKMTDRGVLEWMPDKTNRDYVEELAGHPKQRDFARLSRVFDYVWYGEFSLERSQYEKYAADFSDFVI